MNIFLQKSFLRNSVILIALLSFVLFLIPINHSLVLDKGGVLTYSYAQQQGGGQGGGQQGKGQGGGQQSGGNQGGSQQGKQEGQENGTTTPDTASKVNESLLNLRLPLIGMYIKFILFVIQAILGIIIFVIAFFLGLAININVDLLSPSSNVAVAVGWNIFRVLANLGFVLGVIIVAIATILRIKSYSSQQILWKLIAAALLVNFSLVIAGSILNISDSLSSYFLKALTGYGISRDNLLNDWTVVKEGKATISSDNSKMIDGIASSVTDFSGSATIVSPEKPPDEDNKSWLAKIWEKAKNAAKDVVDAIAPSIGQLIAMQINIITLMIIAASLATLFGLVFVRYFYITALLILSPIVWLMWVFPFGQRWWKEWWNHFLKWTFMLPLNLFFLWFAIKMMSGVKVSVMKISRESLENASNLREFFLGGGFSLSAIMGSLIAAAFIVMGMKLAQSIGIKTAEGVVKGVENGAARLKEYSKIGVAKVYTRTGLASGVQKTLTDIGSTKLGRFMGVGKLAQRHQLASSRLEKKGLAGIDEKMKKYEEMGAGNVEKLLKTALMPEEKKAMLAFLASKGRVGRDSEVFKHLGEAKMLQMAEELEKIGKKNEADEIRLALGKNKEIYEAEQAFKKEQTEENRKRLENAVRNFNQKYSKAEQQRKINKTVFSDANPADEAAKLRQKLQAEFINSDISGSRFQGVNRELETTEQYVNLFENMIGTQQGVELSDPEVRGAFDAVFKERRPGSLQELKQTLIKKGADPMQVDRIIKQIKSSPLGIGLKAKGGDKKKEQEGGGGPQIITDISDQAFKKALAMEQARRDAMASGREVLTRGGSQDSVGRVAEREGQKIIGQQEKRENDGGNRIIITG
jgi:hypothetical protein